MNKNHPVRSFAARRRDLRRLLKIKGWLDRARITELRDPFGPATRRKRLDALVVSEETRANGLNVNVLRRRQGLEPVRLYVVRMVRADDDRLISDTRICRGEVDPQGRVRGKAARRIR
jgi:pantetheine-phosphate adenylyltransferase